EKLYELDKSQVDAMESVKENLNDMQNFIATLETMFESGDLSISNYSVKAVKDIEGFRGIMESIYGEEDIYAIILDKMQRGAPISDIERDELYDYFQNEILNGEKRKEIGEIASFINEDDIHKIKERLNEDVIVSQKSLMTEMAMIQ